MSMDPWHLEPRLDEMLSDPILHLLRARDGVSEPELRALIERARQRVLSPPATICGASGAASLALA
ncbi:MAG: hypothetical protein U1E53_07275 [Dongiaceae bacterium]